MYKSYENFFKDELQEKILDSIKEVIRKKLPLLVNAKIFVIELKLEAYKSASVYIMDNKDHNLFSIYTHPKIGLIDHDKNIINEECFGILKDIEKIINDLKEYLFYSENIFQISIFKL